ncbi:MULTISPECIES: glutathione S-transferase family protein [unclassified Pseudomonas]|uniref:glutathione S-transferase family protein n=1 Tax=unclassified Pseudomonas TaxID=196821 RepID=UPI000A1EE02E|nr:MULTISPECIES: glutathione S-transferase family protein [unclassified Pseudomonas]MDI2143539.1 glutathione S-transferase family protein [Pseudomonas sp. ITA]
MDLTLYYHPLSSYCHKVLIALYEHGTAFDRRVIDLSSEAERAELRALWPLVKFPVLQDRARQRSVPESSVIIEYLDHYHARAGRLIPTDWDTALQVRLWDRFFDNYVMTPMSQIVADRIHSRNADLSSQRTLLNTAYDMLENQLATHPWIASPDYSMADCSASPALFYASTLVPFGADRPRLSAYFERLVQRPSFRQVIDEAKPWFDFYPFAEALPQRFR